MSDNAAETRARVVLFKDTGKWYTDELWRVPADAIGPQDMERSPDFRRIAGGAVLVETQEPWGYPHLIPASKGRDDVKVRDRVLAVAAHLDQSHFMDGKSEETAPGRKIRAAIEGSDKGGAEPDDRQQPSSAPEALVSIAVEAIDQRLSWASLHWDIPDTECRRAMAVAVVDAFAKSDALADLECLARLRKWAEFQSSVAHDARDHWIKAAGRAEENASAEYTARRTAEEEVLTSRTVVRSILSVCRNTDGDWLDSTAEVPVGEVLRMVQECGADPEALMAEGGA